MRYPYTIGNALRKLDNLLRPRWPKLAHTELFYYQYGNRRQVLRWLRILFVPWWEYARVLKQATQLWDDSGAWRSIADRLERQLAQKEKELADLRTYNAVLRGRLDEFAVQEINKSALPVQAKASPKGGVLVKTPFGVITHNSCPDPFRVLPPLDANRPSTWPSV